MRYEVILTEDANFDLEEIYNYIAMHDALSGGTTSHSTRLSKNASQVAGYKADYVLDSMEEVIKNLATFPERGSYPGELLDLGIREYRQTFFKPYRVIYRIIGSIVYVQLISDGRREMVSLLARRLLGLR